ncbi:MAG: outer membrane beta-barrel protein [Rhodospirillaceae bacterium]|nr:outer membrane beta-barrel protein [Rhodospirillaceae bacterium]
MVAVRLLAFGLLLSAGLCLWRGEARAQLQELSLDFAEQARKESVLGRVRPEFKAIGIETEYLPSFEEFPKAEVRFGYEDNLFRTETDEKSDFFLAFLPSLSIKSNWESHQFEFESKAHFQRWQEFESEDFDDFSFRSKLRVDIDERSSAFVELRHGRAHEGRGAVDDEGGQEVTTFFDTSAEIGGDYGGGSIISTKASAKIQRLNYGDNDINHDDRDRDEFFVRNRWTYEDVPGSRFFLEPSINVQRFVDSFDDDLENRDSFAWQMLAGLTIDYSGVTFLAFNGGYIKRSFTDPTFDNVDGLTMNGKVTWNVTGLTTVTAGVHRNFEGTNLAGASQIDATGGDLQIDHELLYSLLLSAGATYEINEFVEQPRDDTDWDAFLGFRYFMNRQLSFRGDYRHSERQSSEAGSSFDNNAVTFRILGQI